MSSYKGLLLNFDINPVPLPRFWQLVICALSCALLVLSIRSIYNSPLSSFPFYVSILSLFIFYGFYFYWAYRCYQEFVSLTRPESPRVISCQQGIWEMRLHSGTQIQKLYLKNYYLNSHYIVLRFLDLETISKFKPWEGKKTVMIFPEQLGEEKFRLLYRLLKFQHRALSVSE